MNVEEARNIFAEFYPNLPLAVKKAVKFTLTNWDEMRNIPPAPPPFEFTVDDALAFLNDLPKLPTDARVEDKTFISKLNCAVAALQTDLNVWCRLEDFPHEEWRDIAGYEEHYQVSNYGRVKSFYCNKVTIRKLIRKPVVIKDGYIQISLDKDGERKCVGLHIIVAKTFLPNPENKPLVHHRDTNRGNNLLSNLKWATHQENSDYAAQMGSYAKEKGCASPYSKLTEEQVRYIREHYVPRNREFGANALTRKFKVSHGTILNVIHYDTYKNVE